MSDNNVVLTEEICILDNTYLVYKKFRVTEYIDTGGF